MTLYCDSKVDYVTSSSIVNKQLDQHRTPEAIKIYFKKFSAGLCADSSIPLRIIFVICYIIIGPSSPQPKVNKQPPSLLPEASSKQRLFVTHEAFFSACH